MTDDDNSTMSDAERLGYAIDELGRARTLLATAMIFEEQIDRPDLSKAERRTIDARMTTLISVGEIIVDVAQHLEALLAETKAKGPAFGD